MFGAGNVMPLDRSGSLEQPMFKRFNEKLAAGKWCHLFAEGKIFQKWRFGVDEPQLGAFKYGIGKLIAHMPEGVDPIIVSETASLYYPMSYHNNAYVLLH